MRHDEQEPVYYISIVARLLNTHPQTLRMYERFGLIEPKRRGHTRLFSQSDLDRIRRIQHLTQDLGVNLAGVEVVFKLLDEMDQLRRDTSEELARMRAQFEQDLATLRSQLGVELPRPQPTAGPDASRRRPPLRIPVTEG